MSSSDARVVTDTLSPKMRSAVMYTFLRRFVKVVTFSIVLMICNWACSNTLLPKLSDENRVRVLTNY